MLLHGHYYADALWRDKEATIVTVVALMFQIVHIMSQYAGAGLFAAGADEVPLQRPRVEPAPDEDIEARAKDQAQAK